MAMTYTDLATRLRDLYPDKYKDWEDEDLVRSFISSDEGIKDYIYDWQKLYTPGEGEEQERSSHTDFVGFQLKQQTSNLKPWFWGTMAAAQKGLTGGESLGVYAEEARQEANKQTQQYLADNPEIAGYMQWIEDEPVTSENWWHLEIFKRGLAQAAPSMATMIATDIALIPLTGGVGAIANKARKGTNILGNILKTGKNLKKTRTAGTMTTMGALEGSGEYNEAMSYLVDEKGTDLFEAQQTAALSSMVVGGINGIIEYLPLGRFKNQIFNNKDANTKLTRWAIDKITDNGWLKGGGTVTDEMIKQLIAEGGQEWTQHMVQAMTQIAYKEGYEGDTPKDVLDKFLAEAMSPEAINATYSGAVMGTTMGSVSGLSKAVLSPSEVEGIDDSGYDKTEIIYPDEDTEVADVDTKTTINIDERKDDAKLTDNQLVLRAFVGKGVGELNEEETSRKTGLEEDLGSDFDIPEVQTAWKERIQDIVVNDPTAIKDFPEEHQDMLKEFVEAEFGQDLSNQINQILDPTEDITTPPPTDDKVDQDIKPDVKVDEQIVDDSQIIDPTAEDQVGDAKITPVGLSKTEAPAEGETLVETKTDKAGRTFKYFSTTKDKDGVKTTTFTFNRSDKSKDQRNPAGVSVEKALGDKYQVKKEDLDDLKDVDGKDVTVTKVFEIREGETGASATVEFTMADGNKFRGEVRLEKKEAPVDIVDLWSAEGIQTIEYKGNKYDVDVNFGTITNQKTGKKLDSGSPTGLGVMKQVDWEQEAPAEDTMDLGEKEVSPIGVSHVKFKDKKNIDKDIVDVNTVMEETEGVTWRSGHKSVWFGERDYSYVGAYHKAKPMPDSIKRLQTKVEKALGLEEGYYNSVLMNTLPAGVGIKKHADNENILRFEDNAIGSVGVLSLGGTSVIDIFDLKGNKIESHTIEEGDIYELPSGDFQNAYMHAVGPSDAPRHSLTFRKTAPQPGQTELKLQRLETSKFRFLSQNKEVADRIIVGLENKYPEVSTVIERILYDDKLREVAGLAINRVAAWSYSKGRLDTPPHEYAHVFINHMKDDPIIQQGIKQFSDKKDPEHSLIYYIGEYYAGRELKGMPKTKVAKFKQWLRKFWVHIKKAFGKPAEYIAQEFFEGGKMFQGARKVMQEQIMTGRDRREALADDYDPEDAADYERIATDSNATQAKIAAWQMGGQRREVAATLKTIDVINKKFDTKRWNKQGVIVNDYLINTFTKALSKPETDLIKSVIKAEGLEGQKVTAEDLNLALLKYTYPVTIERAVTVSGELDSMDIGAFYPDAEDLMFRRRELREENPTLSDAEIDVLVNQWNNEVIAEQGLDLPTDAPSVAYRNLTAPGGENYQIFNLNVPFKVRKAHPAFVSNKSIGWFRADSPKNDINTLRVNEFQSDLFQKYAKTLEVVVEGEAGKPPLEEHNTFLKTLAAGSWEKFMMNSIIQWAASQGYDKVQFPTGDTIRVIEGFQNLDEMIAEAREILRENTFDVQTRDNMNDQEYSEAIREQAVAQANLDHLLGGKDNASIIDNFYNSVGIKLKKIRGKENFRQITDEHGNTWWETDIDLDQDLGDVAYYQALEQVTTEVVDEITPRTARWHKIRNLFKDAWTRVQSIHKELHGDVGQKVAEEQYVRAMEEKLPEWAINSFYDWATDAFGLEYKDEWSQDLDSNENYYLDDYESDRVVGKLLEEINEGMTVIGKDLDFRYLSGVNAKINHALGIVIPIDQEKSWNSQATRAANNSPDLWIENTLEDFTGLKPENLTDRQRDMLKLKYHQVRNMIRINRNDIAKNSQLNAIIVLKNGQPEFYYKGEAHFQTKKTNPEYDREFLAGKDTGLIWVNVKDIFSHDVYVDNKGVASKPYINEKYDPLTKAEMFKLVNDMVNKYGIVLAFNRGDSKFAFATVTEAHKELARNEDALNEYWVNEGMNPDQIKNLTTGSRIWNAAHIARYEAVAKYYPEFMNDTLDNVFKRIKIPFTPSIKANNMRDITVKLMKKENISFVWPDGNETKAYKNDTYSGDGGSLISKDLISAFYESIGIGKYSKESKNVLWQVDDNGSFFVKHLMYNPLGPVKVYENYGQDNEKLIAEVREDGNIYAFETPKAWNIRTVTKFMNDNGLLNAPAQRIMDVFTDDAGLGINGISAAVEKVLDKSEGQFDEWTIHQKLEWIATKPKMLKNFIRKVMNQSEATKAEAMAMTQVDMILTDDEAKVMTGSYGDFMNTGQTFIISGQSIGHIHSSEDRKESAAYPDQELNYIEDEVLDDEFRRHIMPSITRRIQTIMRYPRGNSQANITKFTEYLRRGPFNAIDNIMADMFELGAGLHRSVAGFLAEALQTRGIEPALTMDKMFGGAVEKMQWDTTGNISENGVSISKRNASYVYSKYAEIEGGDIKDAKKLSIEEINEWLEENEVWVLGYRMPIPHINGAGMFRIESIHNQSNVSFLNPEAIFKQLEGDGDGDTFYMHALPDPMIRPYLDYFNSPEMLYKRGVGVNLKDYVPKDRKKYDFTNIKDVIELSEALLAGKNAISEIAKMQRVYGQLRKTFQEIVINGRTIKLKTPDHVFKTDKIKKGSSHTLEEIFRLYLQAAVDNGRFFLLKDWNYSRDSLRKQLWQGIDGKPITDLEYIAISRLMDFHGGNSNIRAGGSYAIGHHNLIETLNLSKRYLDYVGYDPETDQLGMAQSRSNFMIEHIGPVTFTNVDTGVTYNATVDNILYKDGVHLQEEIILQPAIEYSKFKRSGEEGSPVTFQGFHKDINTDVPSLYNIAHDYAIHELQVEKEGIEVTSKDNQAGASYAHRMGRAFYNMFENFHKQDKEPGFMGWSTNQDMVNFTHKWMNEFKKLSVGAQRVATITWLEGVQREGYQVRFPNYLPPVSARPTGITLLDPDIMHKYFNLYHEVLNDPENRRNDKLRERSNFTAYNYQIIKDGCK